MGSEARGIGEGLAIPIAPPVLVPHFNGFPAAQVTCNAAPGFSTGEAIKAMEKVAAEVLPSGYGFAWSGMAYEEKKSGGTSAVAFAFGLIIVFHLLAAQFESWILRFAERGRKKNALEGRGPDTPSGGIQPGDREP